MDPDTTIPVIFFRLLLVLFLLLIESIFSFLEISLISINKLKLNNTLEDEYEEHGDLAKILENSVEYIASLQFIKVSITIYISIYITLYIYPFLKQHFFAISFSQIQALEILLILLIILSIAFLVVTFGEKIPKKVALAKMYKPPYILIRQMYYISMLVYPFVKFSSWITDFLLKFFNGTGKDIDEKVSEEEIRALVETASEKGVFNDIEKEMINSIFSFNDITAKDIMVSRKDTYKIDINEPLSKYLDETIESYYSRIPVYKENIDDIIGILNTKDLLFEARKIGFENIKIETLLQKPYFVPEMKSIDELFKEMQRLKNHMAILVDEYGGFSGIVTLEDLIEEVMGEINDEYDDDENDIVTLSPSEFLLSGTAEIREINKELHLELENENYDTISGLLIEKLGYIPKNNEKPIVMIDNLSFKVEMASENRIQKIRLTILPEQKEEIET